MKVKNNKAINNLALSGIKNNIKKYALLSIAVILTTLMFSSFFTIVGSILNELQLASMRRAGGSAHAEIKYLCQSEYDILKKDSKFKDISYRIVVGFVRDERLKKLNVEVNYFEPLNAKGSFCYPEEGRMPEAENEIVLSDLTLKELGVPKEIGSEFSLDLLIGNEVKTYDFVLCGSYRGDPISFAQQALVSEKFQQKYAPVKQTSFFEETDFNYSGYIMADINFRNSFNIQKKLDKLMSRTGLNNSNSGVNWAYMTSSIDPLAIVLMIMFLAVFFFAGYLIIYNIFYLNIISDTQEYGLLKTIGTTGKQIRQIVLRRASLLSLFGIPIGLILGIGVGAYLLPVITEDLNTVSFDKGKVHLNVWIILLTVVFSYSALQISPSSAKKASPSSGSASISSYFVFATRSTVLKVSRCCGPTEVSRPICGCTSRHISLMSPTWRAPISDTNTRCPGSSFDRITFVTPMGVLKLAGVTSVWYFSSRIVPRINLTLVFPQLPVIPILMRSFRSRRIRWASRKYISLMAFSIGQASRPHSAIHSGRKSGKRKKRIRK